MTRHLALAILTLGVALPARADVESDLGLDAHASALGSAVGAVGGHYTAAAYNPGALILRADAVGLSELGANFAIAAPSVWVTGADGRAWTALSSDATCDTCRVAPIEPTYGLTVGARFDVGRAVGAPGLVLGLALYTPVDGLVQSVIRPDDTPQWLMLTDRTRHITIYAALAYRIAEWLSVGAGARVIVDEEVFITGLASDVRTEIDPMSGEERVVAGARLGVTTAIYGRVSPTAGVLVTPLPSLRFGFTWRGELYSDDWGASRLQGIEAVADIGFLHRFVHVYRPHELTFSTAFAPLPELDLSFDLTWAMWSQAPSPSFARLEGRFGDVLIPAVGARAEVHPGVRVLAGYRYVRRPFDDFGGPTNLLVADAHHPSLGLELDLDRLIEDDVPFTLTLAGRLAIFEDREEVKNGRRFAHDRALFENPGYPGYRYGGLVPSVQLGVETAW